MTSTRIAVLRVGGLAFTHKSGLTLAFAVAGRFHCLGAFQARILVPLFLADFLLQLIEETRNKGSLVHLGYQWSFSKTCLFATQVFSLGFVEREMTPRHQIKSFAIKASSNPLGVHP